MRKRLFLLAICLLAILTVSAQSVSQLEALQKAQQFMKNKKFTVSSKSRGTSPSDEHSQGYYVFNADDGGFVIVAGDERMPEILGYSEHGKINVESVPCGLKWLLSCYEQMAKDVAVNNNQSVRSRTRAAKAPIAPLITTTWGQSTPYNAMCPNVDGAKALTGCVATAMAQIMNYHRWPNEVTEPIPAYTTNTSNVSMPQLEPTTFNWGHLNKTNLSKLMLYCGQAVEMDYGSDFSGAYAASVAEAMVNYFGYDETISYVEHDSYTDDQWNNLLYNELVAKRPILYGGDDGIAGHAFVLSGFDNDLFYINWGWNGMADGYYVLDGISKSLGGYNYNQRAIIYINPKGTPAPVTYYPRRVVMENEAWIHNGQYVPGIESIRRLSEDYPDNFIGINMHMSDPMENADNYRDVIEKMSCNPYCLINRATNEFTPVYPDIKSIVEAQKDYAVATVSASAVYAKPDKSAIKVVADCAFGFDGVNEDFRFAFVLLEDKVGPFTHDNSFYSNPEAPDDPNDWLNEWRHKGTQVEMLFDNVARGIYGSPWGIASSIPSTVNKGETYHYEYTFNVPNPETWDTYQTTVFNKENFRIVALLIDKSTGEILNACQTQIDYNASVETQTFEYRNKEKRLVADEELSWNSKGVAEDNLVLGTNLKQNGLTLTTFDGKQASGTATLEILTNTLGNAILTWGMSGEDVSVLGNSQTIFFTTKDNGQAEVQLKANNINQFGELEAKLTATINGFSQSVIIKFIHQQSEVQVGDDIELNEDQGWWYNCQMTSSNEIAGLMFGSGKQERYYLATYIPANLLGGKVPTIDGISFYGSSVGMGNVKVWISSHLPARGEEPDIATYSFPRENVDINKFNDMVFNQHYQVPENGVYVGYSFDIVDMNAHRSGSPIFYSEKTRDGALWWMTDSDPEWRSQQDYVQGDLAIKILFGGNVQKRNSARIKRVIPLFELVNTEIFPLFEVENDGIEPITSFEVEMDGNTWEILMNDYPLNPYSSYICSSLVTNSGSVAEYQQKTITITKVNGKPNESENSSGTGQFFISRQKSPTVAVMEEFTGTWCGWSLTANKALNIYQEMFGDKLIEICAHGSSLLQKDPMEIPEYSEIRKLGQGNYPSCLINRTRGDGYDYDFDDWMAPYWDGYGEGTFNLDVNINNVLNRIMPGSIEVSAVWDNDSKDAIKIQTRTTFELDASKLPFEIGYVLLEDGMSGEGEEWAQYNYFITDDHNFDDIAALPEMNYGYKYNNVPVAAWDAYKGVSGSLIGPFKAGVPVEGSFLADIKDNTLIQNKENLSVVALIVNKETGKIINAAKCKVTPAEAITISSAKQVPYYSEYNLDFTDKPELKAYVATGYDKSTGVIWLTRVKQVPAETGFLLMGDPGDYDIPTIDGVSDVYYKNMFKGTLEGTTLYTTDGDYTNYYLSKGDAGVGFYKVTKEDGVKVGANRCYLPILTEIPANGSTGDTELIKVSAAKQVPYFTSKNLDFSSLDAQGVKAYTATGYNYSTGVIWLTRVKKVPAQTGILVMADVEGDYNVPTASVQSVYENMFWGSETAQTIYTNEEIDGVDYVNYYLSKGDAGVGFYKVTNEDGVKMGANRCYLPIPKRDAASSARGKNRGTGTFCKMILSDESNDDVIAIPVFGGMNGEDDGTTGIEVQSSIFNLQSDGVYYNLQGQRVEKPRKGIYIHNGRRVVIK